ncbi:MAG: PD-(D/E)XK nuclease family protein [Verrucomicrobia bacterium]|nr:PD-(D/E)XK nuclease family protein [Verrucomicrobiota bacterium]
MLAKKAGLYNVNLSEPFRLSRFKVDLFCQCPRCFYLDRKLGVSKPSGAPFTLNNTVDTLLKREFDSYREKGIVHPFLKEKGIEAVPFAHPEIEDWRNNKVGIQYLHLSTNFCLYGAIDDVWLLPTGELAIVDYKAKSTTEEITLEPKRKKNGEIVKTDRYLISYQKQIEFYQWLFQMKGFKVSKTAYFVFANALKDSESFVDRLEFERVLISHEGDTSWIEPTIKAAFNCLNSEDLPESGHECDFCKYRAAAQAVEYIKIDEVT